MSVCLHMCERKAVELNCLYKQFLCYFDSNARLIYCFGGRAKALNGVEEVGRRRREGTDEKEVFVSKQILSTSEFAYSKFA